MDNSQQPLQPQQQQQYPIQTPQEYAYQPPTFPASSAVHNGAFESDEKAQIAQEQYMYQQQQQQMPIYPPPSAAGPYPGGQPMAMADPYQQQNIVLLCGLCNQNVKPEFQTVTKYNSNANIAGVIFGFICPCFVLGCCGSPLGGKAEQVTVRLCPSCKVPI